MTSHPPPPAARGTPKLEALLDDTPVDHFEECHRYYNRACECSCEAGKDRDAAWAELSALKARADQLEKALLDLYDNTDAAEFRDTENRIAFTDARIAALCALSSPVTGGETNGS